MDQQQDLAAMIMVLREYMRELVEPMTAADLMQLFATVLTNRHSIMTCDCRDIGSAVFDKLSRVNHSCDPNAVLIFESPSSVVASLKCLRDIKEGEEITISYISSLLPFNERQTILQNEYYFKCSCLKCKSDQLADPLCGFRCRCKYGYFSITDEQTEKYRQKAVNLECIKCKNIAIGFNHTLEKYCNEKRAIEDLFDKLDMNSPDTYVALVRQIDSIELLLMPSHHFLMKCWSRLVSTFDSLNMIPEALKYSQKLVKSMELILPDLHPELLNRQFYNCQLLASIAPDIKTSIAEYQKCIAKASKLYSENTNHYLKLQIGRLEELKHIYQNAIEFRAR